MHFADNAGIAGAKTIRATLVVRFSATSAFVAASSVALSANQSLSGSDLDCFSAIAVAETAGGWQRSTQGRSTTAARRYSDPRENSAAPVSVMRAGTSAWPAVSGPYA